MLEVTGLSAGYQGKNVVEDIHVEVGAGEAVAIIGSNGAGKTTPFRALCGVLALARGQVRFGGANITGRPTHRIARAGLAYVPAERHLFPGMSVRENLVLGAYPGRPDPAAVELVFDLFPRREERRSQPAGSLSGGEQQMLRWAAPSCPAPASWCSTNPPPVWPLSWPRARTRRCSR